MIKQKLKLYIQNSLFQPKPYDIFFNPYFITRRKLYVVLRKYINNRFSRTLDFGCGEKPYKSLFSTNDYVGVDIKVSGHNNKNSVIDVYYDGEMLPFTDQSFDCIFSSEVFEHLFNLNEMLLELKRVLSDDGQMIITVPFAWPEHEQPFDFGRYTTFALDQIINDAGLKVKRRVKTGSYISVLGQLIINYVYMRIFPKNKYFRLILTPLLAPLTLITLVLDFLLPRDMTLYHNHVMILTKKKSTNC